MSFATDLEALRNGALSFDDFATRHDQRFKRWARYFLKRWPTTFLELEDLAQEGMLEAWRAVDTWKPGGKRLDRWVEYHVGRKLQVELERVLGWPKKGRRQPARPEVMDPETMDERFEDGQIPAHRRIELAEAADNLEDPMMRDVVIGVGLGLSIRSIATTMYNDPRRRKIYALDSPETTLTRVHMAARKATNQINAHPV